MKVITKVLDSSYLDGVIFYDSSCDNDIKIRLRKADLNFGRLEIIRGKRKSRLYDSLIWVHFSMQQRCGSGQ